MFANRVTTSKGSIQVLRNAWNLVASGVMLLFNVFLYTVTLWDSDMYGFVSEHGLSVAPPHLLSVVPLQLV